MNEVSKSDICELRDRVRRLELAMEANTAMTQEVKNLLITAKGINAIGKWFFSIALAVLGAYATWRGLK